MCARTTLSRPTLGEIAGELDADFSPDDTPLCRKSHQQGEIRTFALDAFREIAWLRGESFEYPADNRPEQLTEGAFGVIRGEPSMARVMEPPSLSKSVARELGHVLAWYNNLTRSTQSAGS
jgi:hypothetical protein